MIRRLPLLVVATLAATCVTPTFAGDDAGRTVVTFEMTYPTGSGEALFLLGDLPELGGGNVIDAPKMAAVGSGPGGTTWRMNAALPNGKSYTYQYVLRQSALFRWSDPNNATYLGNPIAANTPDPNPALRDLSIVFKTDPGVATATFNTRSGPQVAPIEPFAPQPGWFVTTLADQPAGDGLSADVDGRVIETPLHSVLWQGGMLYNYVPEPISSPLGRVTTIVIPTATIPSTRTIDGVTGRGIRIWTPRGYTLHPQRRYPVLYFHDGQNVFNPGGPFGSWAADLTAAQLLLEAQLPEIIMVGIDNSSQRSAEYVPELGNSTVDNDDYNSFIVNELKPYIDANYRTLPDRDNTAIAGSSFGGVASLSIGMDYPQVFGKVGAFSTSFWATSIRQQMINGQFPANVILYLDCGDQSDGGDNTIAVRDAVLAQGRAIMGDFFFQIGYGDAHNEAAWSSRLPAAMKFLFPIGAYPNLAAVTVAPGDLTGDGCVDLGDLGLLFGCWGTYCGDQTGDFQTDLADLGIVFANWGGGCE